MSFSYYIYSSFLDLHPVVVTSSKTQASCERVDRKPLKAFPTFLIPSTNCILFYHSHEPYFEFTNFYPQPVKIDGVIWPTTEHYFQAQKFIGTPYCEFIRKLPTPREAFHFSRVPTVAKWQRRNWANVKDDVMLKALAEKFTQNEILKCKLLETGHCKLIEHTDRDSYWGDGGDGSGLNRLGELLMQLRIILQSKKETALKRERQSSGSRLRRSSSFSGSINRLHLNNEISTTKQHLQVSADDSFQYHTQLPATTMRRSNTSSASYNIITGTDW